MLLADFQQELERERLKANVADLEVIRFRAGEVIGGVIEEAEDLVRLAFDRMYDPQMRAAFNAGPDIRDLANQVNSKRIDVENFRKYFYRRNPAVQLIKVKQRLQEKADSRDFMKTEKMVYQAMLSDAHSVDLAFRGLEEEVVSLRALMGELEENLIRATSHSKEV